MASAWLGFQVHKRNRMRRAGGKFEKECYLLFRPRDFWLHVMSGIMVVKEETKRCAFTSLSFSAQLRLE